MTGVRADDEGALAVGTAARLISEPGPNLLAWSDGLPAIGRLVCGVGECQQEEEGQRGMVMFFMTLRFCNG